MFVMMAFATNMFVTALLCYLEYFTFVDDAVAGSRSGRTPGRMYVHLSRCTARIRTSFPTVDGAYPITTT